MESSKLKSGYDIFNSVKAISTFRGKILTTQQGLAFNITWFRVNQN